MNIRIEAFEHPFNSKIPLKYTCDGDEVSPEIVWSDAQEGTQNFAIAMLSLDDPKTNPQTPPVLWMVYNIPSEVNEIKTGELPPKALVGTNDLGKTKYTGPCPFPGPDHQRYEVRLYALNRLLDLENGVNSSTFFDAIKDHILEEVSIIGTYERYKK